MRRSSLGWAFAWLILLGPASVRAQAPRRFLPDPALVPRLIAGPLEPRTAARLVFSLDSPTAFGEVVEGEASFGSSLPVVRLSGSQPGDFVLLGIGGGVVARFNMETKERELISSDWVFTLPLIVRRGAHWVRLQFFHTSAHLGDEYLELFDVSREPHGRDAIDGLASFALGSGFRLYAGGRWSVHIDPRDDKRVAVRCGFEYTRPGSSGVRFFAAADVKSDADNEWTPRVDVRTGLWVSPPTRWPGARLEAGFYHGPPFQGQFADLSRTDFSIGVALSL